MSEVTIRKVKTEDVGEISQLMEQLGYPATVEQVRSRISRDETLEPGS